MEYIGLFTAILCNITLSILDKHSSGKLTNNKEVIFFSLLKTVMCALLSFLLLPFDSLQIDRNGVVISILAGVFHAGSVVLIMKSLQRTLAVYVNLFMSAGIILPTIFGHFFLQQSITIINAVFFIVLFPALALTLNFKRGGSFDAKYLIPMFFCYGMLMIMQNIFPHYSENSSKIVFSAIMYGTSAVLLAIIAPLRAGKPRFGKNIYMLSVVIAMVNLVINILLTSLSGQMNAIVIFPATHGIKLVAITLLSSVLWREKLTKIQLVGSFLVILCICMISIR